MIFSIITPSYGQLDWLRLCIASVADQVGEEGKGSEVRGSEVGGRRSKGGKVESVTNPHLHTFEPSNLPTAHSPLAIEHIIQDGGTPGIEEFAIEVGKEL